MANEARVTVNLTIQKDNLQYPGMRPSAFQADVAGTKGPSPGAINVPTGGVDVYFAELTTPGLCELINLDQTNYVEYGVKDPQTNVFYPLGEILPGEKYVVRLSRNLGEQYAGSGTGTTTPENYLRLKANGAACTVIVNAFER